MSEKIEWTDELILELIEAYRSEELLWNPSNNLYHNNNKKKDAWKRLSELFGCKEGDIKKKIDSLLSLFRRERQKSKSHSGDGAEDVYVSTWFAFKHMQFLMDKFTPRKTIDNVVSVPHGSSDDVEDINVSESQNENTTAKDNCENTAEQGQKSQRDMQPKIRNKSDKKRQREEDPRIDEAYSILKDTIAQRVRDESTVFGEHVTNKHRKYNSQIRSIIEHKINDILFQADMGYLSHNYYQATNSPHGSTSSYGSIVIQPSISSPQPQTFHTLTSPNSTPFQTSAPLPSPQNISTQYEYEQPTKNIMQFVSEFTGE